MRTGLVFLLRALAALTIACMAILAAVTAIGLVLIAVGALALADHYSLLRVAGNVGARDRRTAQRQPTRLPRRLRPRRRRRPRRISGQAPVIVTDTRPLTVGRRYEG